MIMRIKLFTIILTVFVGFASAQVEKPETENPIFPVFNLDDLNPFTPGNLLSSIPKKFGEGTNIELKKALKIKKFFLIHDAYKFPIWVQHFNDTIIDFYTRLPSYFLHDTFHQSLINRYGNQSFYALKDSTALFKWENETTKRIYSGGCTITCYPIYYAVANKSAQKIPTTYRPLYEHFVKTGF